MTTSTMTQFVNRNNARLICDWADENPNMPERDMNHWKCVLKVNGKQMTFHFSQGYGISGEPDVKNVLDCLASDASGYENASSFEDWASEYGYDTDSRSAERTYNAIAKQSDALRRVMGDQYDTLLWNTERL
jgi:hypothetical protein